MQGTYSTTTSFECSWSTCYSDFTKCHWVSDQGVFAWIHMSLCLLTCIFLFSHILHLFPYPWFGFRLCQQHSIWFLNLLFTLCLAPAILFYLALIGYISQCTIFSLNLPCLVLYSSVLKYASIANTIKHA